jgi:hypothetical protein
MKAQIKTKEFSMLNQLPQHQGKDSATAKKS